MFIFIEATIITILKLTETATNNKPAKKKKTKAKLLELVPTMTVPPSSLKADPLIVLSVSLTPLAI